MYSRTKRGTAVAAVLIAIGVSYPALASPAPVSPGASVALALALQFERGDLVKLRSGGPAMTVSAVKGDQVECVWTDDTGQPDDASFPAIVLKKL